ncbi:hypothetical protein BJ742DRAFT_836476 [Cladochytrium replicatum]|nr:hypothetical protein BJ742DRAFT_836476 [Cladochytrium replicatum]
MLFFRFKQFPLALVRRLPAANPLFTRRLESSASVGVSGGVDESLIDMTIRLARSDPAVAKALLTLKERADNERAEKEKEKERAEKEKERAEKEKERAEKEKERAEKEKERAEKEKERAEKEKERAEKEKERGEKEKERTLRKLDMSEVKCAQLLFAAGQLTVRGVIETLEKRLLSMADREKINRVDVWTKIFTTHSELKSAPGACNFKSAKDAAADIAETYRQTSTDIHTFWADTRTSVVSIHSAIPDRSVCLLNHLASLVARFKFVGVGPNMIDDGAEGTIDKSGDS